jgi:serine/tyrosine/threonine adenylyltransferase
MPIPFPYDIEPPVPPDPVEDKSLYIEKWLSAREAIHPTTPNAQHNSLQLLEPRNRDQPRELLGFSETALKDCLPHLEVGDAFAMLGTPSLASSFNEEGESMPSEFEGAISARQELIDVLSGHKALMSSPDAKTPFAPWSLRYSGHQFGSWAGQLGDGRAISIR